MKTIALLGFAVFVCLTGAALSAAPLDSWTLRDSKLGTGGSLTGLDYGDGVYVAVGGAGKVTTSLDGVNWTSGTIGTTQVLSDVAFHNHTFVIVGAGGTVFTSTDKGQTWQQQVIPNFQGSFNRIRYLNGQFVAEPWGAVVATSPDGVTWQFSGPAPGGPTDNYYNATYGGDGRYVVVGKWSTIVTSTDASANATWTPVTLPGSSFGDVAFGIVNNTPTWVIVGFQGQLFTSTAIDASSWTQQSSIPIGGGNGFSTVVFSPEAGLFVAVGSNGSVYSSADGVNWGAHPVPGMPTMWNVKYVNGAFMAVGDNYSIYQSGPIGPVQPGLVDYGILDNNRLPVVETPLTMAQSGFFPTDLVVRFRTLETQTLHISLSGIQANSLTILGTELSVQLSNSSGVPVTATTPKTTVYNPTGSLAINNDYLNQPAGEYSITVHLKTYLPNPVPFNLTVSGGPNWAVITEANSNLAHHVGVRAVTADPAAIGKSPKFSAPKANLPSWLIVHGRASKPADLAHLEAALAGEGAVSRQNPKPKQLLVVDWETAAADNYPPIPVQGERWIKKVGDFAAERLLVGTNTLGIVGNNVSLVGHSWGAYVARQVGYDLLRSTGTRANFLIALDPALIGAAVTDGAQGKESMGALNANGSLIPLNHGAVDFTQLNKLVNPVYFQVVAQSSWAFYSSPFGNLPNALTAKDTFLVLNQFKDFNLGWVRATVGAEFQAILDYGIDAMFDTDTAVDAHRAATEVLAIMLLQNEGYLTPTPQSQVNPNRFAISPIAGWELSRVYCTDKNNVVVRRTPYLPFLSEALFPLEGVLTIDAGFFPTALQP